MFNEIYWLGLTATKKGMVDGQDNSLLPFPHFVLLASFHRITCPT